MKKQFTLGQEVAITGRLVINPVSPAEVDEVEARIKASGQPESSNKYSVEKFEHQKVGIIAGIRSIVGSRIHYLDSNGQVVTKTTRQPAYLVATDMRGLCYVPLEMVSKTKDWKDLLSEEFGEYAAKHSHHGCCVCDDDDDFDLDDDFDEFEDELYA